MTLMRFAPPPQIDLLMIISPPTRVGGASKSAREGGAAGIGNIQSRSCAVEQLVLSSSYELSVMWTKLKMVVQLFLSWFNRMQKN